MAEKARTMPHQRGRGPRPKLDHPGQTLGRVLKYVGRKYWLHLIFVVVSIFVSVFAMVQGTLFTKTLIDSYILPLVQQVQAGQTADFTGLMHAITRVALFYACGVIASFVQYPRDDLRHPGHPAGPAAGSVRPHGKACPSATLTPMPTATSCPSTPTTSTPSAR